MNRVWIVLAALVLCGLPALGFAGQDYTGAEWVPGQLIVNFVESVGTLQDMTPPSGTVAMGIPAIDALMARYHVYSARRVVDDKILSLLKIPPDFLRCMLLDCPKETDILKMMADFSANPLVDYAEPDLLCRTFDRTPNDVLWVNQWDKRLMNCPRAWDYGTGSRDITVIAIDGGTYWPHEDFRANLWVNPGEDIDQDGVVYTDADYPGDPDDINGVDDDGDGKIDDLIGWDFLRGVSGCASGEDCDNQEDNDPIAVGDHGTHVLGLMGAAGNNETGVAGVNWNVTIMASRAGYLSNQDQGYVAQAASVPCMLWAVSKGANVLNMSYGSASQSSTERNAITSCWNNGAILCGAAGNDHVTGTFYPAGYANVVSVGSVDGDDQVSDFSNYGTWVDVYSPGNMVESTVIPGYTEYPGTSMASPNCAGIMALIWSIFPDYTNQQIVDLVLNHCQSITAVNPGYNPNQLGHGRVDAGLVLASQFPHIALQNSETYGDNDDDNRIEAGETGSLSLTFHNDEGWSTGENVMVTVTCSDPDITITDGTISLGTVASGATVENANNPVHITASANFFQVRNVDFNVHVTADGGMNLNFPITLRIGRPQTVVVADDGIDTYDQYFESGLIDEAGTSYNCDVWNSYTAGDPTFQDIHDYAIILWICGNESSNTINAANQQLLTQMLNNGCRLLVAGQNIDEDISGTTFYSDVLRAQTAGSATDRNINGVATDPISDGTRLLLIGGGCGGNGAVSPSKITPVNGGIGFFNYASGGCCAVRAETGISKVAYFSFALEAACGLGGSTHYQMIIQRTMQWFGAIPGSAIEEPGVAAPLPQGFALKGNYPNPFNPTTTLAYDLARGTNVSLKVFDLQGREVANLVNGFVPAGSHTISFDGSNLASGMYLARMLAGGQSSTQRMVLMK